MYICSQLVFLYGKGSKNYVSMMVPTKVPRTLYQWWFLRLKNLQQEYVDSTLPPRMLARHYKPMTWTIFRFRNPHINRKEFATIASRNYRNLPTKTSLFVSKSPRCRKFTKFKTTESPHIPFLTGLHSVRPLSHRWGGATNQIFFRGGCSETMGW